MYTLGGYSHDLDQKEQNDNICTHLYLVLNIITQCRTLLIFMLLIFMGFSL